MTDFTQILNIFPCFFPLLFAGFVILLWYMTSVWEQQKIKRLQEFALRNGFEFRVNLGTSGDGWFEQMFSGVQSNAGFLTAYDGFQPISRVNATVKYIFNGRAGDLPFQAFHYQYTTGSGKNRQTHYFTVASVDMPMWMPNLSVSLEGFFDMVGKFFGGQDIQLESHDFNEKFRIVGSSEKVAHDILHPQMMEWFMHVVPPGFQMHGNKVVLWRNGTLEENFVLDSRAMLAQFWNLVPDYVKEEGRF